MDHLARCLSAASFRVPSRFTLSAWIEHAPFAFWLVEAYRPAVLVELGCQYGYSYLTFCQAVQEHGLPTRCHGVDTWRGDDHAGFYGEHVYSDLRHYHDPRYSEFSTLVRAAFDDALSGFADGSIDLLHIDGSHSYDDVKHDFESWRPKLSARAIVLFHDTQIRERNFGVYRFWAELSRQFPHFEFLHGCGLGVLGAGNDPALAEFPLFAASRDAVASGAIRDAYARLGAALTLQVKLAELEQHRPKSRLVQYLRRWRSRGRGVTTLG